LITKEPTTWRYTFVRKTGLGCWPQCQLCLLCFCIFRGMISIEKPRRLRAAFLKLWSADHKWSSGSALVVLLDLTLVQKRQKK